MSHPLTANLGMLYRDTASFARDAAVTYFFILAAIAFIVLNRPKNSFTEEPVFLGF
jgi:hypothetical protein